MSVHNSHTSVNVCMHEIKQYPCQNGCLYECVYVCFHPEYSQVASLPLQSVTLEVANFCAAMDTLIDQRRYGAAGNRGNPTDPLVKGAGKPVWSCRNRAIPSTKITLPVI